MWARGASVVFMTELIAPSPAERTWDPALSASRAKEYERCPLQYRLHVVDGYREPESRAKALGTLVHAVLEDLFSLPPLSRTRDAAGARLAPAFEALTQKNPEVAALFDDEADREAWLEDARSVVDGYFAIEQPQWIAPAAREARVTATTKGGVRLLGFIDRVDRAPDGRLRVVDYKTGKAPSPRYVDEALFQMRFYALLLARTQVLPSRMQLVYPLLPMSPTSRGASISSGGASRKTSPTIPSSLARIPCATGVACDPYVPSLVAPLPRCHPSTPDGWRGLG